MSHLLISWMMTGEKQICLSHVWFIDVILLLLSDWSCISSHTDSYISILTVLHHRKEWKKKTIFLFWTRPLSGSTKSIRLQHLTCFSENKGKEKHSLCCSFSRKHLLSGFPVTAAEAQKELRSVWRANLYNFTTQKTQTLQLPHIHVHVYPAFPHYALFTINKRKKKQRSICIKSFRI